MTAEANPENSNYSVLERGSTVLEALGWEEGITLAEISRRTGIPRSSAHRILQQLMAIAWVERVGYRYRLGVAVRELGQRVMGQSRIRRAVIPPMYQVRDATGLSIHVSVLSGFDSVNIETVWGNRAVRPFFGQRKPANATACGKVLLAGLPDLEVVLDAVPELTAVTRYTITSKDVLRRQVHKARADEMAVARQENHVRTASVAVPIGPPSQATHALSVSGLAEHVRPNEVVRHLRVAAAAAWADATALVRRGGASRLRRTG